jgi:hypothetical protein
MRVDQPSAKLVLMAASVAVTITVSIGGFSRAAVRKSSLAQAAARRAGHGLGPIALTDRMIWRETRVGSRHAPV